MLNYGYHHTVHTDKACSYKLWEVACFFNSVQIKDVCTLGKP